MIRLNKTITKEAIEAMSRNTIVAGGAIDATVMQVFDEELKKRIDKIPSATLKKAIEESVRETATEKLINAQADQVKQIVDDSFDAITKALGIAAPEPRRAPPPPPTPRFGGK